MKIRYVLGLLIGLTAVIASTYYVVTAYSVKNVTEKSTDKQNSTSENKVIEGTMYIPQTDKTAQ